MVCKVLLGKQNRMCACYSDLKCGHFQESEWRLSGMLPTTWLIRKRHKSGFYSRCVFEYWSNMTFTGVKMSFYARSVCIYNLLGMDSPRYEQKGIVHTLHDLNDTT